VGLWVVFLLVYTEPREICRGLLPETRKELKDRDEKKRGLSVN